MQQCNHQYSGSGLGGMLGISPALSQTIKNNIWETHLVGIGNSELAQIKMFIRSMLVF